MLDKDWFSKYQNYIIVAITSLLAVVVLPFLGSTVGLALVLPTTIGGWIVWGLSKLGIVCFNLMIFHSFIKQAEINIKDNTRYKEAKEILIETEQKSNYVPLSPKQYFGHVYGKKGATLAITTALSVFGLANAILVFDLVVFLTYTLTIIMAVLFSLFEMKNAEVYWTEEFYLHAKYRQKQMIEEQEQQKTQLMENKETNNEEISNPEPGRTSPEECL